MNKTSHEVSRYNLGVWTVLFYENKKTKFWTLLYVETNI